MLPVIFYENYQCQEKTIYKQEISKLEAYLQCCASVLNPGKKIPQFVRLYLGQNNCSQNSCKKPQQDKKLNRGKVEVNKVAFVLLSGKKEIPRFNISVNNSLHKNSNFLNKCKCYL